MRHHTKSIFFISIFATLQVFSAYAADFTIDGVAYDILEGEERAVAVAPLPFSDETQVFYNGRIEIPQFVVNDGTTYSVVAVSDNCFRNSIELTNVSLPSTIRSLGEYAFANCRALTEIIIPETVKHIGDGCFQSCRSLETVTLPDGIEEVPQYAFSLCDGLQTMILPSSVKIISSYAFFKNPKLTTVALPEDVSVIGARAFAYCESLVSPVSGRAISKIGDSAFAYCSALNSVELTSEVVVEQGAFANCKSIESLDFTNFTGVLADNVFANCIGLKSVAFGPSMTSLPSSLFLNCSALETVEFPFGLVEIGDACFSGCSGLKILNFPSSIRMYGERCFAGCNNVVQINFSGNGGIISNGAFENLTSLEWLYLKGIVEVGDRAFANCAGLSWIELPEDLVSLGQYSFTGCPRLWEIYVHGVVPPLLSVTAFDAYTESVAHLLVQEDALEIFRQAAQWNRFKTIKVAEGFPNSVTQPGNASPVISYINGCIYVDPEVAEVRIYDMDGRLVTRVAGGELSGNKVAQGIYVVSSSRGSQIIKL